MKWKFLNKLLNYSVAFKNIDESKFDDWTKVTTLMMTTIGLQDTKINRVYGLNVNPVDENLEKRISDIEGPLINALGDSDVAHHVCSYFRG